MFRKFTALLMLTSFTHAFAMSPVMETSAMSKALENTFDSMNYSLNVEWDQKDQQTLKTIVDGFETEIQSLQAQGLTNKELVEFTLAKIKDKQTQEELAEIAKVADETQMSTDEARDFALSKLNGTYSQGTSWSGHRMGVKMHVILGILIIILCVKKHRDHNDRDRHDRPTKPECNGQVYDLAAPTYPGDNCYPGLA